MNRKNIVLGMVGGITGGLVFGMLMAMMGMLPMIGRMVGSDSALVGLLVHLVISGAIGASFAVLFGGRIHGPRSGGAYGLLYGGFWWLLGPLTLMPLFMGMGLGTNWNLPAAAQMLPSLMGHLIYGVVLGVVYGARVSCSIAPLGARA